MTIIVSHLGLDDKAQWEELYRGYATFYKVPMSTQILETVWGWIFSDQPRIFSLIAKDAQGNATGLMHYRAMPSPLRGTCICFLDDLFVDPKSRGTGSVDALFARLEKEAAAHGWSAVRWITAENNYRARAVYDRLAAKTQWTTYQLDIL